MTYVLHKISRRQVLIMDWQLPFREIDVSPLLQVLRYAPEA